MSYRYRWIYAGCCALLAGWVGYFADIKILIQEKESLTASAELLGQQTRWKPAVHQESRRSDLFAGENSLSTFSRLLYEHHLELQALIKNTASSDQGENYQVALNGDYKHLYSFLLALREYEIKDFSLAAESEHRVHAEFQLWESDIKRNDKQNPTEMQQAINPFCAARKNDVTTRSQRFTQSEMRLLGNIIRDNKRADIYLLPNGAIVETLNPAMS